MKLNKKKVLVTALAVSLIAILSFGTIAWFSAEDSVTNNFYIADSSDNTPDDIFSVYVYENDGTYDYDKGISYTEILPGDELVKKAYVKNTGHYDQYVRVIITISDKDVWQKIVEDNNMDFATYDIRQHFDGFDSTKWDLEKSTMEYTTKNEIQYVLYYNCILPADQTITVFEGVTIPTFMTQEHASHFDDDGSWGFTIDVKAQAVQTENVGAENSQHPCYTAFETVLGN